MSWPMVETDLINVPAERVRATFTKEKHDELFSSMKNFGFTVPILITPKPGGMYDLIDGEHRILVAKELGITKVPAVIVEGDVKKVTLLNALANTARGSQNPMDVARALARCRDVGATADEMAAAYGHTREWVTFYLNLCELPDVYQAALHDEVLHVGHVRECLRLWNPEEIDACLGTAIQLRWKVEVTKNYVDQRMIRWQVAQASKDTAIVRAPPTVEEAREIVEYGDCLTCGRKIPRRDLRMPTICPECYELTQYVTGQLGPPKDAMQIIYEALQLYWRATRTNVPSAIQHDVGPQQPAEQQPSTPEDDAIAKISRSIAQEIVKALKGQGPGEGSGA